MIPRHLALASVATIVANMYALDHCAHLARTHDEIAKELLKNPEMPPEILDAYAEELAASVRDLAPAFQSLQALAQRRTPVIPPEPPTLKQLPQDTEFDALLETLNAPGTKGTQS